jgi:hypothetical protein
MDLMVQKEDLKLKELRKNIKFPSIIQIPETHFHTCEEEITKVILAPDMESMVSIGSQGAKTKRVIIHLLPKLKGKMEPKLSYFKRSIYPKFFTHRIKEIGYFPEPLKEIYYISETVVMRSGYTRQEIDEQKQQQTVSIEYWSLADGKKRGEYYKSPPGYKYSACATSAIGNLFVLMNLAYKVKPQFGSWNLPDNKDLKPMMIKVFTGGEIFEQSYAFDYSSGDTTLAREVLPHVTAMCVSQNETFTCTASKKGRWASKPILWNRKFEAFHVFEPLPDIMNRRVPVSSVTFCNTNPESGECAAKMLTCVYENGKVCRWDIYRNNKEFGEKKSLGRVQMIQLGPQGDSVIILRRIMATMKLQIFKTKSGLEMTSLQYNIESGSKGMGGCGLMKPNMPAIFMDRGNLIVCHGGAENETHKLLNTIDGRCEGDFVTYAVFPSTMLSGKYFRNYDQSVCAFMTYCQNDTQFYVNLYDVNKKQAL